MLGSSMRVRGVRFAFLFGPPRQLTREEASSIHDRACKALGLDDIAFAYSKQRLASEGDGPDFSIRMKRAEGRGGLEIAVDLAAELDALRLYMAYEWPPSLEHARQTFDGASKAVLEGGADRWTRVMAEARLMADCSAPSGNASGYLASELLRIEPAWLEEFGKPLDFASIKLETFAQPSTETLKSPHRELTIEVLRQDATRLYVELLSKWPQVVMTSTGGMEQVRPIDGRPSQYLEDARQFLVRRLEALYPMRSS